MRLYCPKCLQPKLFMSERRFSIKKAGRFYRKSDGRWSQRYFCLPCRLRFSRATFHPCYRQKKRHRNFELIKEFSSGVSQRRAAKKLCLSRRTVARKLRFLGLRAKEELALINASLPKVKEFEFDDLETFEHTKLKPLSVTLAVVKGARRALGFAVSEMPANGLLAQKSVQKYGPRKDQRAKGRRELFRSIRPYLAHTATAKSDQNPHYVYDVKRCLPHVQHVRFKGRQPRAQGLGELKKGGFDPLFSLNHTCAMMRYGISRLIRKTWCTTKSKECLHHHIAIYLAYHNRHLIW